jgi:hypothetical protein
VYIHLNKMDRQKNHHLLEVTRVFFQNNIPKGTWSDAIFTATCLINRLSSANLDYKSPLEIFCQEKININNLKLFGCIYFVHKNKQDKLDCAFIKVIFLRYSSHKRSSYVMIRSKNKFYISRHVMF